MKKNMYCYDCDKDVLPIIKEETNTYNVRGLSVSVKETVYYCPNCGLELIDDTFDDSAHKAYDAYLKKFNLSFEAFTEIRNSLNLTQELFAKALGWSKKAINRYENAQSLPQIEYLNTYKKLKENKNEIFGILRLNKDNMDKKDYYAIVNRINAEIDMKTINAFLYLLNKVTLNTTQLMKHFFAMDFESKKTLGSPITSFKYAHCPHGPIIDNQEAYLNLLIGQNYLELKINDWGKETIFKAKQECDLNLFNQEEIKIMDKVIKVMAGKSAKELSDWSHNFVGWKETKEGKIIGYQYAKDFELEKNW